MDNGTRVEEKKSGTGTAISLAKFKCSLRSAKKNIKLLLLQIDDYIWPSRLLLFFHLFSLGLFLIFAQPEFSAKFNSWIWSLEDSFHYFKVLPKWIRGLILSGLFAITVFVLWFKARQLIIRRLLGYRGWLYRESSKRMIIWGLFLKLMTGKNPRLFNCQRILPRLPVPSLRQTFDRLIESTSASMNEEELDQFKREAEKFRRKAWLLQIIIKIRSYFVANYISSWWEKYVYLAARNPLSVTTNYHGVADSYSTPTKCQRSRGATVTYLAVKAKEMIDRGEFTPLMILRTIPFCSHFYKSVYSTTRIPGKEYDSIARFSPSESRHVIVSSQGLMYKLTVYDSVNEILPPHTIESQIEWIQKDAQERMGSVTEGEKSIAALTTLPRTDWAILREKYLIPNERNRKSLREIESAIMGLVLSEISPKNLSEKAYLQCLADGKSIFYDKSMTVVVGKDATAGGNSEHSVADGSPVTHVWEWIRTQELMGKWYTEDDTTCIPPPMKFGYKGQISPPEPLYWEISPEFEQEILKAVELSLKQNADIDFVVTDHFEWGKGFMKKHKLSPDAFIQVSMQYAFYLDLGYLPHTYEATMTRLFHMGRTETVRSLSPEVVAFIRSMTDTTKTKKERVKLLRGAIDKHQTLFKDAMSGKGIDRHLFALAVVGKALNYDVSFLEKVLGKSWSLSSSQTPINLIENVPDFDTPYFKQKMAPGGGFITVDDEGYGVAYVFGADSRIFFQISSKHSSSKTSSRRFSDILFSAMEEIRRLLD